MPFASAIASSSESYGVTVQTGPKTSSHDDLRVGRRVRRSTVGRRSSPSSVAAGEDVARPRARASSIHASTRSRSAREISGPTSVVLVRRIADRRAPRRAGGSARGTRRTRSARRRSAAPRCSSGRRSENAFAASRVAASSRSASAATITGVALPSSRFTRLRGARSRSFQPTRGRAGERDELHALVLDEHVADLARGPADDVEPARREARLRLELGEEKRGERRLRRRLQDDRAAGGERRRDLVRDEVEREVERRDRADDADRAGGA